MPSRAIGMGMCPRCGRPGTVVIKAGNYVYIKHGNTWHYIGTIDKVNLNKILIKNDKEFMINKNINSIIRRNLFTNKLYIGLLVSTVILIAFMAIIFIMHVNEPNNVYMNTNSSHKIISCLHASLMNNTNNIIELCNSSNSVSIIYINSSNLYHIHDNQSIFYVYMNATK